MRKVSRAQDLTGRRFSRLFVESRVNNDRRGVWFRCRCACGSVKDIESAHLRSGRTRSCGCLLKESATKHGLHNSPEYAVWRDMKRRCNNPNAPYYVDYGGRGIKVDSRWEESFQIFYEEVGARPSPKHVLDRFPDNDGDYVPGNVRWTSQRENLLNRIRVTEENKVTLLRRVLLKCSVSEIRKALEEQSIRL